jgi:succinate-semialdehyde dehydrogenase/glutarate-semialdehyde dehydrogenase
MKTYTTINPATNQPLTTWNQLDDAQSLACVDQAASTWTSWRRTSLADRAIPLLRCAALLRERKDSLAALMAREMGKPVRQGMAEAEKCAWVCEFYAAQAEAFLAPEPVKTEAQKSYVAFEPLGVILAVMPWNFPLWQFFRFAAPTLMAGNTVVLKHAMNTSGSSMAIGDIMRDAGYPAGAVVPVIIDHRQIESMIRHPAIRGVTLTGSTRAGQTVGAAAGAALKRSVLELGGSDPYVILEDADIASAAELCTTSRLINSGQSCIAAKRFIVVESVQKPFEEAMLAAMKKRVVGDPLDPTTDVGPQARADLRDELHEQVQKSIAAGAVRLLGSELPTGPGSYYPVSMLTHVEKGMPAFDEELFGPVAAIISARNENHAIELANDSIFGLGAAVFTRDLQRGEAIARHELQAGCCFVNDFVKSDPRLPFGGILESGYGRELGRAGMLEFVNTKSIVVK